MPLLQHLSPFLRCLLVIFMYFASFYARGEKCILVNLLISRILEEVNVDEMCVVLSIESQLCG